MSAEEYLKVILQPLLSKPEALKVTSSTDDMGILLSVICGREDMGVIIGKSGKTAECIRHLVRIVGIKADARVSIKINEPDGRPYRPRVREAIEIA